MAAAAASHATVPDHRIVEVAPSEDRRSPYPETPAIEAGAFLDVGDGHEVFGNPDSPNVVVYLHGGPGAGCSPRAPLMFDPAFYRIVIFDQRGSGRSKPNGEIAKANTTWHLVSDIELLRTKVAKVEQWAVVFGGSWGSTLSLAYAQKHPTRVRSLVLRGIFLFDQAAINWLFQSGGVSEIHPDAFSRYAGHIAPGERSDLLGAYHRRVMSDDMAVALPAAREFVRWELSVSTLRRMDAEALDALLADASFSLPFARAETHFFVYGGWFPDPAQEAAGDDPGKPEGEEAGAGQELLGAGGPCGMGHDALPYLLRHCDRIAHIPTWIVHGRNDVVCRPRAAFELFRRLKRCQLEFVHDAGHSEGEPGTTDRLLAATDAAKALC